MATVKQPGKPGQQKLTPTGKETKQKGVIEKVSHRDLLDELENRIDEVRRRFDLYFNGSPEQKQPPTTHQAQLGGEFRKLREEEVRSWNTIEKFRFNQLFARFVSLDRMWARVMKQIEDGTYKRDKFKVAQMKKKEEAAPTQTQVGQRPDSLDGMDVDVNSFEDEKPVADKPRAPQPVSGMGKAVPAPVVTGGSSPPSGGSMSDQRLKQLYDVYMQAKKRTGEQSSLTMEALKKQIEKQIPAIKAKHNCQNVDFKVVLKDGKAMLKAVPK
jgi:hypothetical protein